MRDASGDEGAATGAILRPVGGLSPVIGTIQSVYGSASLTRADVAVVQVKTGYPVCQGDVIETAADGQVAIRFIDDTVFNLSFNSRVALNEFICDSNGALQSGRFGVARGNFAFRAGQVATAGFLTIETPAASIRGRARSGGIGTLSLTALTFAILEEAHAQNANGTLFFNGGTFLDDGIITYKDMAHGIVELQVHGQTALQYLSDPGKQFSSARSGPTTTSIILRTRRRTWRSCNRSRMTRLALFWSGC